MQFVADGGNALNTFRHGHSLFSLRLALNEAAQGDNTLIRFNGDIGTLDVLMINQGRFHLRRDCAVIHVVTDFIH
ncbi:hypothetical protein D3C78_1809240 [compost metagenome]